MIVVDNTLITESLFQLTLAPGELSESFKIPGQYVVVNLENQKPLYLVIASKVGDSHWNFLVRDTNPSTKVLKELKSGVSVNVTPAQGKGYPMDKLMGQNIVLFSAGTGLASFYSVISEIVGHRSNYERVVLLHGSRFESELPFKDEMLKWVHDEIEVYVALSKPSDSWAFHEGHVQSILNHEKIDLTDYKALICGPNQMVKDVSVVAAEFGLSPKDIFSNY